VGIASTELSIGYYITDTSLYFRGGVSFINRRYSAAESVISTVKNIATTLPTATVKENTVPTLPASERREFPTQAHTPASKRKSSSELGGEPIVKKRQDGSDTVSTLPASERREFPTQAPTPASKRKSSSELGEEPIAKKRQDGLDTVSTVPASERREFPTQAPTPASKRKSTSELEEEPVAKKRQESDTSLLQRLLHTVLLYIDANNLYGVRTQQPYIPILF
jgi:hypothetical protein